ncbi:hypothetical protein QPK87_37925 [Kamptonema cortianum]|nr:hypothetical protein [Kamptonema cortianum]
MKDTFLRLLSLAFVLFAMVGCRFGTLPDPNDDSQTYVTGAILQRNVAEAYRLLDLRVARGEIGLAERDNLIRELVLNMLENVDPSKIPNNDAFRYADLYRQAGKLEVAQQLMERAVETAKTPDRKVNDTLQLGRIQALRGNVKEAIKTVRSTFDSPPRDKAPILLFVLYEFVPAALGKESELDAQIGQVLEGAIDQHLMTVVDPELKNGQAFLEASPKHLQNAWRKLFEIYREAGREDLLRAAIEHKDRIDSDQGEF